MFKILKYLKCKEAIRISEKEIYYLNERNIDVNGGIYYAYESWIIAFL